MKAHDRRTDPTADELEDARGWPQDELPCVWMTAGLIAFQLCPRGYDCDNCPLDAALAGGRHEPLVQHGSARLELPQDRGYHPSHVWAQPLAGGRVRYGVDAFAARLLDRVATVVLPPEGSRVERGAPAWWLADDGELIPFRAPDAGRVARANHGVQRDPSLLSRSPYERGWLLEVELDGADARPAAALSAQELRHESARQLRGLHRAKRECAAGGRAVGATLADGGARVHDLRAIFGTRRYHRLLRRILG